MILGNIISQTEGLGNVPNVLTIKGGCHGNCKEKNDNQKNDCKKESTCKKKEITLF
jgi:hypothetical protein